MPDKTDSGEQLYKLDEIDNPFQSAINSEVSDTEISFKYQRVKDSINMASAEVSQHSAESIEFGHSAMSGRSNTSRRRIQKAERMKKMAQLHGKDENSQ